MSDILNEELDSMFVAPDKAFNGEALAPYTEGSRLLLMQTRDENDSHVFFIWSFVYLHLCLAKNKKEAIQLAWKKDEFREKVFEFLSDKTEKDRDKATDIVSKMINEASAAHVTPIQQGGAEAGKV